MLTVFCAPLGKTSRENLMQTSLEYLPDTNCRRHFRRDTLQSLLLLISQYSGWKIQIAQYTGKSGAQKFRFPVHRNFRLG
jgi:hypothetical protein